MNNPLMNDVAANQTQEKPTHYLNLKLVDQNGNEYRINTGIPLGGKYEKALTPALVKAFEADPEKQFKLVGSINSAATKVVDDISL